MATAISANAATAYSAPSTPQNSASNLKSEDFISLLITQLQNQDPMEPMKNQEILQQVSQIGQLQSQTELSSSLKDMVLQNQVSAASGMIGKSVTGTDENGKELKGNVSSVKVVDKAVVLKLDTGSELQMSRVTAVNSATADTASTSATGTGTSQADLAALLNSLLGKTTN